MAATIFFRIGGVMDISLKCIFVDPFWTMENSMTNHQEAKRFKKYVNLYARSAETFYFCYFIEHSFQQICNPPIIS